MPPTPIVRQNGQALRAFRTMRGLSVNDLAEEAKVSPQALRNWELEHRFLPIVKAERLCVVLGIAVAAISRDRVENLQVADADVQAAC
jgi:transcriptional regulator with XRE-family HTH domain